MAERGDRPVAANLRDDRGRANQDVVAVRVVTRDDGDSSAGEAPHKATKPIGVHVTRVDPNPVGSELAHEARECLGLEPVETSVRNDAVDGPRREGHRAPPPHRREGRIDLLAPCRRERFRVGRPEIAKRVDAVGRDEESADHERSEHAASAGLVDPQVPLHRPGSFPARDARQRIKAACRSPVMGLDGLVVPIPTLFNDDGDLDPGRNSKFARALSEARVDHLFALGSLGEFPSLTDPERASFEELVIESASGRTDVWVGCGAPSTRQAVRYAEEAETAGAAAIVAVPPYYLHPPLAAVERYYRAIHGAISVPLLAYNIPSLVGYSLPPALVHGLAHEGVLAGVKDTAGSLESVAAFLTGAPDAFAVLPGDDVLASAAIARGATGAVMGIANVVPALCVELVARARAGDRSRAEELQTLVDEVVRASRAGPFPSTDKFLAAHLRGSEVGYRAPYDRLTDAEERTVLSRLEPIRAQLRPFLPG